MRANRRVFITLVLLGLSGCVGPRDTWSRGLSRCASNDTLDTKTLVFLGPSNTYGPGSGWRKAPSGVLESRFSLEKAMLNADDRKRYVTPGNTANCESFRTEEWKISPSIVLTAVASPIQAKLGIDVMRNKTVDVRVKSWRLDRLEELLYETWMASDQSGNFGKDLLATDRDPRFVMKNAVAVNGFHAILMLDATDSGKLDVPLPVSSTVTVAPSLQVTRTGHDRVEISSEGDFYIVGTFIQVREGVLGAFADRGARLLKPDRIEFSSDTGTVHADIK